MVVEENQKNQPKVDSGNVIKQVFITQTSRMVSGIIVIVPSVIIWVLFFYFMSKNHWFIGMNSNVRGVIIIAVVAAPLLIGAVIQYKLRDYFSQKWQ